MTYARITVPARWTEPSGGARHTPAVFTLGEGPCGLTVTSLDFEIADRCLYIWQRHSDGPDKRFIYPLAQLTGRVEVESL